MGTATPQQKVPEAVIEALDEEEREALSTWEEKFLSIDDIEELMILRSREIDDSTPTTEVVRHCLERLESLEARIDRGSQLRTDTPTTE